MELLAGAMNVAGAVRMVKATADKVAGRLILGPMAEPVGLGRPVHTMIVPLLKIRNRVSITVWQEV